MNDGLITVDFYENSDSATTSASLSLTSYSSSRHLHSKEKINGGIPWLGRGLFACFPLAGGVLFVASLEDILGSNIQLLGHDIYMYLRRRGHRGALW
jgi:hypothetical protein